MGRMTGDSLMTSLVTANCSKFFYCSDRDTIRYDTIEEINVDSKAEYTA